ncbi:MAG: adenylate/guanylate cyclase domain-containing protein, partial [Thermoplasmata archaeon]|nr:adenylate/guanylate cyclase domain-containing protein [Thermoplasmata archaeon]
MASVRRLAAIMFTDWVGFTTLTQSNEQHALTLLEIHQRLLRPVFPRYHGTEIKTIGDAFLVEFDSALEATGCAIEIQRLLHDHNASAASADRIRLRIGIHLGDVVHVDGDVMGDAINVASRIEPLAEPGGICLSDPVAAQVRNRISNSLTKLPAHELKNVRFPIDVYKVELAWNAPPTDPSGSGNARRLAVLPLANMSADPQDAFFADGLTEEIITELSKVAGLRVIARTSVLRYADGTKSVAEIGKELRVSTVLEGSVRRAGNRVRVTAQLIDATSEEHLWAEKYDRELDDIFAIQSEVAKAVAVALGVALPAPVVAPVRPPPSLAAFKPYVRGRSLWNRRTTEHVEAALRSFEEALTLDPEFAEALSGIADCYSILVDRGALPPGDGGPKAKAAAERAIAIDETIAEAHASLGLALDRERAWPEAEREYRRAIELNPMYA